MKAPVNTFLVGGTTEPDIKNITDQRVGTSFEDSNCLQGRKTHFLPPTLTAADALPVAEENVRHTET